MLHIILIFARKFTGHLESVGDHHCGNCTCTGRNVCCWNIHFCWRGGVSIQVQKTGIQGQQDHQTKVIITTSRMKDNTKTSK